jgi:predicted AAA+ superfamily ATPase
MILKRKIYSKLLEWKEETKGKRALLIEGARRIGKSTIVSLFGKSEYKSFILIDFNDVSKIIMDTFNNNLLDLDTFYMIIQAEYNTPLYRRNSLIIFDEIQNFPKARQSIKKLVQDGRYDFIETGSLVSIKENVKNITLPSEERSIKMYPLDFEEFCLAFNEDLLIEYIKKCFNDLIPLDKGLHKKAMLLFRQYMLIGGMPQSIIAYLENDRSFEKADIEKRDILRLYRNDIMKIDKKYQSKVISLFDQIPSFLSKHEKRVVLSNIQKNSNFIQYNDTFFWLEDSMICNHCFNCNDSNIGLSLNEERTYVKCYMADTGLLVSHAFSENEIMENELYKQIIFDKLSINQGMLFENVISQILTSNGHKLFFYNHFNIEKHRNDCEVDFIISNNNKINYKISPIEVKSSNKYSTISIDKFISKFNNRITKSYVVHPNNLSIKDNLICIPPYMVICL